MSHRDADQKNVIDRQGELLLLDWDAAGPVWPRCEIAKEALNWSGVHVGSPDIPSARAMLAGYREAGGAFDLASVADLVEYYAVMLRWMAFNLRRVLGERIDHDGARAIADTNAKRVLEEVPRWLPEQRAWVRALGAG